MKTPIIIMIVAALSLISCANNHSSSQSGTNIQSEMVAPAQTGVKFAPNERTSSLTEDERAAAIAKKQQADVNVETLLSPHSLRLTILPPALTEDITESVCEQIILQLLHITSANGISGVNGSSPIAFALAMNPVERRVTGTIPQKMLITYDATYYILNTQTWDVYASHTTQITGAGDSFELAIRNAVNELNNMGEIQQMIAQAETNIISWFESNRQVLQNRVTQACATKNYAAALAVLNAVPEQATNCHTWANQQILNVTTLWKKQIAHTELTALKDAIAMAMPEYNPAVAAHLAMLPEGSPEAKEGTKLYAQYMQQIDSERLRKIDLEERKRLETLEAQKLQMQYEYEATAKQLEMETEATGEGVGGKLRSFFNGASVWSMASQILTRCLFLF